MKQTSDDRNQPAPVISKSRYLEGLQCHKLLWMRYHASGMFPPPDAATESMFEQGRAVGAYAKQLFPEGMDVVGDYRDFHGLVRRTAGLLKARRPLFEAAFLFDGTYARLDILVPVGDRSWDIIEVKSTGEVKDINLDDVAFQYHVCGGAGLEIRRAFLMHINKEYVRHGSIDPAGLLTREDVTAEVLARLRGVEKSSAEFRRIIAMPEQPSILVGPHCSSPYECPLIDHCWSSLPEDNVFTLYRLPDSRASELLKQGIVSISDLPPDYPLTDRREVQVQAAISGKVQVDRASIGAFLSRLRYPLCFLDFETVHPAVPLYDGTRPFDHVPFQFSLHIVRSEGSEPEHHMFLAEGREDPRPAMLQSLKAVLGSSGSILAYNAGFEERVLAGCCQSLSSDAAWYQGILSRIVDLHEPFSAFSWYHPEQRGGTSMKVVLPLLCGLSYDGMEIADGEAASREFVRVTFRDVSREERMGVHERLREYCGLDTSGMVNIVERLKMLAG